MPRGRQSIKKGVWHIGGRRAQRGGAFPLGLLAGLAEPLIGAVAKPIFKKIVGRGIKRRGRRRRRRAKDGKKEHNTKKTKGSGANKSTKQKIFHVEMEKNK